MTVVADPYADAVTFTFGDNPALADELLALVLSGTQDRDLRCASRLCASSAGDPMPVVGRRDVVLDGQGRRAAVIETIEVSDPPVRRGRRRFCPRRGRRRPDARRLAAWPSNLFRPQWRLLARHGAGMRALPTGRDTGQERRRMSAHCTAAAAAAARCGSRLPPSRCHVSYCHCGDCRRATGAPVSAFVGFMADDVSLTGETLRRFENGPVTRSFCGICGSPIAYVDQRLERRASISCSAPWTCRPTIGRHCTPMCASNCPSSICPTACPDIRRPASPDLTRTHHEAHPLLAEGPSRDRRLACRDRRAADLDRPRGRGRRRQVAA